jgi:hypothetical protein
MEPMDQATIECPYCAEPISQRSKKCKHCGEILDAQMRDIALLKDQQRSAPQVFMNAGGAAAAASSSSGGPIRRFPHWVHIILSIVTTGLWLPIYLLMYWFRNRRYYF